MRSASTHMGQTFLLSCLLAFLCFSPLAAQRDQGSDIAIVVHPDTPVSNLDIAEVRKVFLGDRQYWTPNLAVVLIIRAPVARERDIVLRVIYEMNEVQFKRYWIAKIFRAEAVSAPKIVYSNGMANELVAAMPGAIGFISARDVSKDVKVLRVNGHLPGDPDYALR
jgi:ABC-type phosphate transport system substrate-binding protein